MIKQIVLYFISFLSLFLVVFFIHDFILNNSKSYLPFSLFQMYSFHFSASFIIVSVFLLLSKSIKWASQLGYIYMFTFFTKIMFFVLIFKNSILGDKNLTKLEGLNLLIPVFLFLFLEVYFIAKILNKKQDKKLLKKN
ncbi:DUF6168 family protein [Lacinutrix sp.]|uniref:DUF6168 family protein n=1 Tax=Lacinutrix sp. TaxID=1937692 RepID=UPI003456E4BB